MEGDRGQGSLFVAKGHYGKVIKRLLSRECSYSVPAKLGLLGFELQINDDAWNKLCDKERISAFKAK